MVVAAMAVGLGLFGIGGPGAAATNAMAIAAVETPTRNQVAEDRGEGQATASHAAPDTSFVTFDDRRLRAVATLTVSVTAYCPDVRSCGRWADAQTASGHSIWTNGMKLVAADTDLLPIGTIVTVPGYNHGRPVQVLDRGALIKGHKLDVLFATDRQARQWGEQKLQVTVWAYADG